MKRVLLATLALAAMVPLVSAQSTAPGSSKWEVLSSWGNLPAGTTWEGATQASTTPDGQIVIFRRAVPAFFIVSPDGKLVKSFGDMKYRAAHGVRVDREGFIWATDNADNFVQKISPDGRILMTLGKPGTTGDNTSQDAFDGPADVFVAPNGDIFVADGYRNSRVVQFSKDGKFTKIIGGVKGSKTGQFNIPHSVAWIPEAGLSSPMWKTAGFRFSIPRELFWNSGGIFRKASGLDVTSHPTTLCTSATWIRNRSPS